MKFTERKGLQEATFQVRIRLDARQVALILLAEVDQFPASQSAVESLVRYNLHHFNGYSPERWPRNERSRLDEIEVGNVTSWAKRVQRMFGIEGT